MSASLVLFIAKVCLGLLIAQVWKHKLARSESCEYLLLRVRNYTPSGVTPIYLNEVTFIRLLENLNTLVHEGDTLCCSL